MCPWCRRGREDEIHVFFECPFAKAVWEAGGCRDLIQVLSNDKAFDVLQRVFMKGMKEQIVLTTLFCWSIWNRRNKWVWDRVNISVFGVKSAAMNLPNDWRKARHEVDKYKTVLSTSPRRWSPPTQGHVKINIDATSFLELNCIDVRALIRDEHREFIRARRMRVEGMMQPREADAISLKEALSWTKELGFKNYMFETDAKQLADACNGVQGKSYIHTIVMDCVNYCKHFDNVLIGFIHRSENGVAHMLARAAHSLSDVNEWVNTAPAFILEAIVYDSI